MAHGGILPLRIAIAMTSYDRRHQNQISTFLRAALKLTIQADYDEWAKAVGDPRWSYAQMLPYFRKTESYYQAGLDGYNPSQHGHDGPLHTCIGINRNYPLRQPIKDAFEAIGAEFVPDANNGYPHGYAPCTEK